MMNSIDIEVRMHFLEILAKNPKLLDNLGFFISSKDEEELAQSFVDCVYQNFGYHKPDLFDKYVLYITHQLLNKEAPEYLAFHIFVGKSPYPDKETEQNNEVLKKLNRPFKAHFHGGNQDEDGSLSWSKPIHAPRVIGSEIRWVLLDEKITLPLEVGTNSSRKFNTYMLHGPGVARWPYDSDYITVFINTNRVNIYKHGDDRFNELKAKSGETLDDCLIDRNPWARWKKEVIAAYS